VTLHHDALATLRAWTAPTPDQEAARQRFVGHLEARPDGLSRDCRPDHVTASTLVLSHDLGSALLTLHAKAGAWFQLGGHCEPGDLTLAGAALREAVEESGVAELLLDPVPVQLSEHAVPFCGPHGGVHHLDVRFLAVAPAEARHAVSEESLDVRWWPVGALPEPEPDLVELVRLAVARAQPASTPASVIGSVIGSAIGSATGSTSGATAGSRGLASGTASEGGGSIRAAAEKPSR
jgi:8-oxo-dGTP pyrophosphatase MutT (NUDIX family)